MSIGLKIEKAREEYVKAINEINEKYGLSFYLTELVLIPILNEVRNKKEQELKNEIDYLKESEEKKNGKNNISECDTNSTSDSDD